jgi:hypothetical protein
MKMEGDAEIHYNLGQALEKAIARYPNDRKKLLSLYENMRRRGNTPRR